MATLYGSNATNQLNTSPVALAEQGEGLGRVRVLFDVFTATASGLGATDVIKMGSLLPANSRVLDVMVESEAMGGSCACTFGYAASAQVDSSGTALEAAAAAGFAESLTISSAIRRSSDGTSTGLLNSANSATWKRFTAAVQPQIALSAASSGTVTGKRIWTAIVFVVE